MSLGSCEKCWDNPCTCGWDYRWMSKEQRLNQASKILGIEVEKLSKLTGDFVPEDHPQKEES